MRHSHPMAKGLCRHPGLDPFFLWPLCPLVLSVNATMASQGPGSFTELAVPEMQTGWPVLSLKE